MLCAYKSCPMNAAFKDPGYVGFCTVPDAVTINQDGFCTILNRLLVWFNQDEFSGEINVD